LRARRLAQGRLARRLLCALAWTIHVDLIVKLAIGIAGLLFMLWPVGTLLLIGPRLEMLFTALCLAVVVTLLSVPIFAEALRYFVRVFVGADLGRLVWGVTYMCACVGALAGIAEALWRLRFWLFRNRTIGALLAGGLGLMLMIGVVVGYGF
jgi:hypothetical protein